MIQAQVTFDSARDSEPCFSPDGKQIAFSSDRAGINNPRMGGGSNIWKMNANGSGAAVQLTSSLYDGKADWSPDGSKIVFERGVNRGNTRVVEIWIMDANGNNQKVLLQFGGFNALDPKWSPDGEYITLVRADTSSTGTLDSKTYEIFVFNVKSGNVKQLTNNNLPDAYPCFSADATKILYSHLPQNSGAYDLLIMDLNGIALPALTSAGLYDVRADWSALYDKIVFSRYKTTGQYDLFMINPDGTGLKALTTTDSFADDNADW
jgi:TolB protein